MLGGVGSATALLFNQELFESVGGEGERLSPQLHQVRVLKPSVSEAVSGGRTSPVNVQCIATENQIKYIRNICNSSPEWGLDYLWLFQIKSPATMPPHAMCGARITGRGCRRQLLNTPYKALRLACAAQHVDCALTHPL